MGKEERMIIKRVTLWGLFTMNLFAFLLSACALDSESIIPMIVCAVTGSWIALFIWVNRRYFYVD